MDEIHMDRKEKIQLLLKLRDQGIVRELCPVSNGHGGTAYWRYEVLQIDALPSCFKQEYNRHGEIRW